MCVIADVSPAANIAPVPLEDLRKLEYRGYDLAGIAVLNGAAVQRVRTASGVAELAAASEGVATYAGIAHTPWATRGAPSERNAHPNVSGGIAVVHSDIIENHEALRIALSAHGYVVTSDTDTETIAHLVEAELRTRPDLFDAVLAATRQLVDACAIAVIEERQPGKIVVAREGSPLLLGLVEDGAYTGPYAASDASALLQVTRKLIYLENGDIAGLTADHLRIVDASDAPVERLVVVSQLSADAVELGQYRHYMQKEIFEQPEALANTLELIGNCGRLQPGVFGADVANVLGCVRTVLILASDTSYHSGFTARYWLESVASILCTVEIASECRCCNSVADPDQFVVPISQSDETADTLAALRHAKDLGHPHAGHLQRSEIGHRARMRAALYHSRRSADRHRPPTATCSTSSSPISRSSAPAAASCIASRMPTGASRRPSRSTRCGGRNITTASRQSCTWCPLRLLAYDVSLAKGMDTDKPRSLAKRVIIE